MNESKIIRSVIDCVIDNTGSENFEELNWLFKEYATAVMLENRTSAEEKANV